MTSLCSQGFCGDALAAITHKETNQAVAEGIDAQARAGVVYVDEQSRYKTQQCRFNLPPGKGDKNQYDDDDIRRNTANGEAIDPGCLENQGQENEQNIAGDNHRGRGGFGAVSNCDSSSTRPYGQQC